MLKQIFSWSSKNPLSVADTWFGKPDVIQQLTPDIYFKEWIDLVDSEIVQIYYCQSHDNVSLKTIPKNNNYLVNEIVPWVMEFNERQALDHLVQINPKNYLSFHPDINSLAFTNQDMY